MPKRWMRSRDRSDCSTVHLMPFNKKPTNGFQIAQIIGYVVAVNITHTALPRDGYFSRAGKVEDSTLKFLAES